MTCVKCQGELAEGARFCGACGARQPEPKAAPPHTASRCGCGVELAANTRFCPACGAGSSDSVPIAAAPATHRASPHPAALAEYEALVAVAVRDGILEVDEREDLPQARVRLGIPLSEHERLVAGLFEDVPVDLQFDTAGAHLVAGEATTLTLRLDMLANTSVEQFGVRYRSSSSEGVLRYEGARVARGREQPFWLDIPPPTVAGMHRVEGLIDLRFTDGRTLLLRFALPPLRFAAARGGGPQQVVINQNIDNSRGVMMGDGSGADVFGGPVSAGEVRVGGHSWARVELSPCAPDHLPAWVVGGKPAAAAASAPAAGGGPVAALAAEVLATAPVPEGARSAAPATTCPRCGSATWIATQACAVCGRRSCRELRLIREDGVVIPMGRLVTRVGRPWAMGTLGEDGRFWDTEQQMTFEPHPHGWFLVPNPSAPNETLLNGATLMERVDLEQGMVISVGRAARGVQKTPFSIQLV